MQRSRRSMPLGDFLSILSEIERNYLWVPFPFLANIRLIVYFYKA